MDSLKDLSRGEDPKFLLFANMLEELTKLLAEHGKDLTDITAIIDRASNTKLNINDALVGLDQRYYCTNGAFEYYHFGSNAGVVNSTDSRLIMTDEIKQKPYSDRLPVINPELLFVLKDGFIDFLKVHRFDYDGGHLSYILRYNNLGGINEDQ